MAASVNQRAPWRQDAATVAAELGVDVLEGLSDAEAASRLERFGHNELPSTPPVPWWRALVAQLADPLIYLLGAAVAVSLLAWELDGGNGAPYDAIVIAAIVASNAMLGFVQERRAQEALAALEQMAAPLAEVRRDGRRQRVAAGDVVPGDVLLLGEGDAVSADARLVEAASLMLAEAPLTGESEAVLKDAAPLGQPVGIGDRLNMVWGGTAVTAGHGVAVVTATGTATEIGNIARLLGRAKARPTPLQREVGSIGRKLGIAVIAIAAVVVAAILLTADIRDAADAVDVLLTGVSLAVAAVPEGLPALLTVVLAIGVQRMARRSAVVKRLSSVETLGAASVVCSDKTGTLTCGEMTIQTVVTPSGEADVTGSGYRPDGEVRADGRRLETGPLLEEVAVVLAAGCLANNAALREQSGEWKASGDPTEAAFLVAEAKIDGLTEARSARFERVGEIPFTPERKLMSTLQADRARGRELMVVSKGAPDVLLTRCVSERAGGEVRPLSDRRREQLLATAGRLGDSALRTLAVAYRPLGNAAPRGEHESLEQELIYLGMVGIIDPPRPEAEPAVAEAIGAGVRVMMITGDHPRTAARIASRLGIAPQGSRVISGPQIDALDDRELRATVSDVSVYARVSPEHKLRIVDALQADGMIVAMTGDGVNDAPALKAADIGVAMGSSGTDVAKGAADMILADDNFSTIIAAIREGRAIFANIRKFMRFLLSSNSGEVLTMLLGVLFAGALGLEDTGEAIAVPLLATQILWVNLLTDSAPALALGLDPPLEDVMRRLPRQAAARVIDREMWIAIAWIGLVTATVTLAALDLGLRGGLLGGSGDVTHGRTMAFTTLVLAQLFNCLNARSDRASAFRHLFANRYLWGAIALSTALQVAVVEVAFLNRAFHTAPLAAGDWLICIALASAILWASEARKLVRRKAAG